MASFFLWLFSCCLGGRSEDKATPNERTGLLDQIDGTEIQPDALGNVDGSLFDQNKYEERLQDIVQAKKGAMVDVASPYPFNLKNKPRAVLEAMMQDHSGSSTSRSASASTFRDAHPPRYYHPTAPMTAHTHSQTNVLPSSPDIHPKHSRSRSPSPASSRPRSLAASPGVEINDLPTLSGVLNVRLVRNRRASNDAANMRRGRSKLKRYTEVRVAGDSALSKPIPTPGSLAGDGTEATLSNDVHDAVADVPSSTEHVSTPSPGSSPGDDAAPSGHAKTPAALLQAQDIGPICMSWPE